ncbi:MAG TPA: MSMEG_0568 family radical SAM protein [Candidatus Dormibacteraeota bacterium]|nr:MSMEG_0568 family radical SAM protein [Candidatus Dormibacteraeota bacterium]
MLIELQRFGVQVEEPTPESRKGGAGPSDAGMIWLEGVPVTFPFVSDYVARSPFTLRRDDKGWALYRGQERLGTAVVPPRPRYYDLTTADGVPYWKIALLHLDSLASTVIQTCAYWGTADQCRFCGIQLTLEAGQTIAVKRPEQLAEVARAAKELDGAVDVTLTTGSTRGRDRGALYVGRCARAVKEATGLPVQAQFEPPEDLGVLTTVKELGVDSVGIHVETFDPAVLARVAPAKARTGIEGYFRAWERAVEVFGRGQVSTYVILGMGEDPGLTLEGCRRAIDLGVYPFVVPLRPVPGSLMGDLLPPPPDYVESMYRKVVPYLLARGLTSSTVRAGCARCNACSALSAFERSFGDAPGQRRLAVLDHG